jgi:hypothetical protein
MPGGCFCVDAMEYDATESRSIGSGLVCDSFCLQFFLLEVVKLLRL